MPALIDAGAALAVFVATDIDDLFLLAAFFADRRISTRSIVLGQFTGIAALVLVSALAALLALAIPPGWVALLGLVPLGMGLAALPALWRGSDDDDDDELQQKEQLVERTLHSQVLAVALVTIASGGDNLGVYIPLFANHPDRIGLYVVIFAVMTALWCLLAYKLVHHPHAEHTVRRYGHVLLPPVLIGVGMVILVDARVLLP
jgi:cadmium resistance protein CadD (predicted permease)